MQTCQDKDVLRFERDIWSFGTVMFEIWSIGHSPFEGSESHKVHACPIIINLDWDCVYEDSMITALFL